MIVQNTFALNLDARRSEIISIINEELSEVERLSRQQGNRNPDYLLRMAELNFEKGRLWKDKENEEFLALSTEKRRKINKKRFFIQSEKYFNNAMSLASTLVKKFPSYKNISDVYYILGFDAKEKGNVNKASKYLGDAIKLSKQGTEIKIKSQIALAENYYNRKAYRKAIPLYENALKFKKDRWWTKDSFNLAWCYYRARQYAKSIDTMKDVFNKSSDNRFVDLREQVKRDIGLVYATSGRINDGIKFFEKLGIDFSDELLRIAIQLKEEGKFTEANKVLRYAEKYVKRDDKKIDVHIEQLVLYEKYNQSASHLRVSKSLFQYFKKNALDGRQTQILSYQVGKMGALLQKRVVSKSYKERQKTRQVLASRANAYFAMMMELEPAKASEYRFLMAETHYANAEFVKALTEYEAAFSQSQKDNNRKYANASMDGMLACLAKKSVPKSVKNKFYVPTYESFLQMEPKSKKAWSIYQKLFNTYKDNKQYDEAESVLERFHNVFPTSYGQQEAMIAHLMEVSRQKNDHKKIREWIEKINRGQYKVSNKYRKKLQELLTTIQIDKVQNSLETGDKKQALIGYHRILEDPHSTKRSKINAKYNLAALYYELGAANEAHDWSLKAMDEMEARDVYNFADSFLAIGNYLFGSLYFTRSANVSSKVMMKLCKIKTKRKTIAFKNSAYIYLSNNNLEDVEKLIQVAKQCNVFKGAIREVELELLKDYGVAKRWEKYEKMAEEMSFIKGNWALLIVPYEKLIEVHQKYGNSNRVKELTDKQNRFYQYAKDKRIKLSVEALDVIASKKIQTLNYLYNQLVAVNLLFPEKVYNQLVMKKLALLDQISILVNEIQKIGSGDGIITSYTVLMKSYQDVANALKNFKLPKDKDAGFVNAFNKAMAETYVPLYRKADAVKVEAIKVMNQNDILSSSNIELNQSTDLPVAYWGPYLGVTMDKGGKR